MELSLWHVDLCLFGKCPGLRAETESSGRPISSLVFLEKLLN